MTDGARLQEVYTDESYIHQHNYRDETFLYFPSDDRCLREKEPLKGKRFSCICTIQRGEMNNHTGSVKDSEWRFCPQNSTGDFQKNFNQLYVCY